MDRMIKRKTDR